MRWEVLNRSWKEWYSPALRNVGRDCLALLTEGMIFWRIWSYKYFAPLELKSALTAVTVNLDVIIDAGLEVAVTENG
jgi:hypothetical protein